MGRKGLFLNKLKIGIIGCGEWGWRYAPSFQRTGLAEVTRVFRPKKESLSKVQSCFPDVVVSENWKSVIDECDAVVISTPPQFMEEICLYAILKNTFLIVEKPLTLSSKSVNLIQDSLNTYDIPFLVNHIHLFSGAFEAIQTFVGLSASYPIHISTRAGNFGPFRSYSALWDWAPHDIAMVLALGPGLYEPIRIGCVSKFGSDGKTRHKFDLIYEHTSCLASIEVWNDSGPKTRELEVSSKSGDLFCRYDDVNLPKAVVGTMIDYDPTPPLDRMVSLFVRSCLFGVRDWRFGTFLSSRIAEIIESVECLER